MKAGTRRAPRLFDREELKGPALMLVPEQAAGHPFLTAVAQFR